MKQSPGFARTKRILYVTALLSAPFLLMAFYGYVFDLLHHYDWGHPFTKLICFAGLAGVLAVIRVGTSENVPSRIHLVELALLSGILAWVLVKYQPYFLWATEYPRVDIGQTTQQAAEGFFRDFSNPYVREDFFPRQGFGGFHYGPLMFLGYFLSAFSPALGFKFTSLFFFFVSLILIVMLVAEDKQPWRTNVAASLYALTLALLPERMWYEIVRQGANDIFPAALILLSLVLIKKRSFGPAGLTAGLALSAKFAPAIFYVLLCIRKAHKKSFLTGVLWGLLPVGLFLLWDFQALIRQYFAFHLIKGHDTTSLYDLTPEKLHYVFPLLQLVVIGFFVRRSYSRPFDHRRLTSDLVVLAIIVGLLYREVHGNHMVFFIPFLAPALTWCRYQVWAGPGRFFLRRIRDT